MIYLPWLAFLLVLGWVAWRGTKSREEYLCQMASVREQGSKNPQQEMATLTQRPRIGALRSVMGGEKGTARQKTAKFKAPNKIRAITPAELVPPIDFKIGEDNWIQRPSTDLEK